jgi:general secretion pathway protein L
MIMSEWLIIRLPHGTDATPGWLLVDGEGRPLSALQSGPLGAAAPLAGGRSVAVIVPAADVLLTEVELPQGAAGRAAQLVPYALEEQLVGDLDAQHFATGRPVSGSRVPVAVVARERMRHWLAALAEAGISPDFLCAEHALLPGVSGQAVAMLEGDALSLRDPQDRLQSLGAPPGGLRDALALLLGESAASTVLTFYTTPADWQQRRAEVESLRDALGELRPQLLNSGLLPWLATQVPARTAINLLQGGYAQRRSTGAGWRPWRLAAALAGVLLLSHLGVQGWRLYELGKAEQALDGNLALITAPLALGDTGSARARIEQLLLAAQGGDNRAGLLPAMQALAEALAGAPGARLQSLDFRDGVLQLKLRAGDAQGLERITQSLRSAGWNAELVSGAAAGDAYEGSLRLKGRAS